MWIRSKWKHFMMQEMGKMGVNVWYIQQRLGYHTSLSCFSSSHFAICVPYKYIQGRVCLCVHTNIGVHAEWEPLGVQSQSGVSLYQYLTVDPGNGWIFNMTLEHNKDMVKIRGMQWGRVGRKNESHKGSHHSNWTLFSQFYLSVTKWPKEANQTIMIIFV